jgi:hypothetical protein
MIQSCARWAKVEIGEFLAPKRVVIGSRDRICGVFSVYADVNANDRHWVLRFGIDLSRY